MCRSSLLICATSAHRCVHTQDPRLLAIPRRRSQGGVYVHKDDHDQVEDGPDDPQHGQDALLFALFFLASSVFIIATREDHLGCQCLYLPPQANLQLGRGSRKVMVYKHPLHSWADLLGVGISCPGSRSRVGGTITYGSNLGTRCPWPWPWRNGGVWLSHVKEECPGTGTNRLALASGLGTTHSIESWLIPLP